MPTRRKEQQKDGRYCENDQDGKSMSEIIRKHFVFCGTVQGVGFRYRAHKAAEMTGCTGWVRNEPDGTVTQELQGTDDQIAAYFGAFARVYAAHPIKYVIAEKSDIDVMEGEANFRVRF
jgi:acylphosphatase